MKICTIGFTQKTARQFFGLLSSAGVELLIDVRLNNRSQLAGFAKDPDLCFFLEKICGIGYIHDTMFAPAEDLLKKYRAKEVSWDQYETVFESLMQERKIDPYIREQYANRQEQTVCLLCSEPAADHCHRRLVAEHFSTVFHTEILHL